MEGLASFINTNVADSDPSPPSYERLRASWFAAIAPRPDHPIVVSPRMYADMERLGLVTTGGRLNRSKLNEIRRKEGV